MQPGTLGAEQPGVAIQRFSSTVAFTQESYNASVCVRMKSMVDPRFSLSVIVRCTAQNVKAATPATLHAPSSAGAAHEIHPVELGINFFDTANAYSDGTSEEIVSRALKDFAKRDEIVVATRAWA